MRLAHQAEKPVFHMGLHQARRHRPPGKPARLGHARHLEQGGGGGDVGVQTAGRSGDQIVRHRLAGIFGLQLGGVGGDAVLQLLGGGGE